MSTITLLVLAGLIIAGLLIIFVPMFQGWLLDKQDQNNALDT
jgi:hypothetical protein